MGKKLIITENEKNRILDLYGILRKSLNEATPTTPTKTTTTTTTTLKPVKIKTIFQSGCHSNEGGQSCTPNQLTNIFAPYMEQIKAFLKAAPTNQIVEVVLSASESKVPNRNAELPKVKQKDGTLRHPKLQPKVLSQYRYESIEAYLKSVFEKMVSEKVITKIPEFVKSDVVIGGPAWNPKKGSKHPDYTKHQYLMAVIRLKEVSASETVTKCMTNMEIQINYTDLSKTHTCNNAIYTIFANGIKLFRDDGKDYASLANANGPYDDKPDTCAKLPGRVKGKNPGNPEFLAPNKEKDKACARYNRFIINAELAAEILAKTENPNSPQIKLEATCLDDGWYNTNTYKWTGGCHEGAGNIVIINGNGERFDYSSATPNEFGTSKVLAILDPCGNKIS